MKNCFAKCLLWRLFEPITGSIFQDNKVTVSVPVTERERDSGRPGGHWARAIPPSLVWTSVMRPLHYNYTFTHYTLTSTNLHCTSQYCAVRKLSVANVQLERNYWTPLIKLAFKFHPPTRLIAKTCFQKVLKLMNNDFIRSSHAMNFNSDWRDIGP